MKKLRGIQQYGYHFLKPELLKKVTVYALNDPEHTAVRYADWHVQQALNMDSITAKSSDTFRNISRETESRC